MIYITLDKGKNEKCGGLWDSYGTCASGLNCLKTCKLGCDNDDWYKVHCKYL